MKTQKKVATQLVLGIFRKNTSIGKLADILKDQKPHKLSVVLKSLNKVKKPAYRVQILKEVGKRKRAYRIEKDRKKDLIRMQLTKKQVKKVSVQPATQTAVA